MIMIVMNWKMESSMEVTSLIYQEQFIHIMGLGVLSIKEEFITYKNHSSMKKIHLFLLGMVICCMTAMAQSVLPLVPDSIRINDSEVSDKISNFIVEQTPELKAYFRSLRPLEKAYWEYVCLYDSTLYAWRKDPAKARKIEEVEPYVGNIMNEYNTLSHAAMLSYTDEILANPTIQRLLEEARESIRNGASSNDALHGLFDKLNWLPRYKDCWKMGRLNRQQNRLLAENGALCNALNTLTILDFNNLVLEREGALIVRDT